LRVSSSAANQPVDVVVKVGGGLLADIATLDRVLMIVVEAAQLRGLVVVGGGGPFADAVRAADRRLGLSDTAAHWMAILAMDQYAHLLADRITGGVLACDAREIAAALGANAVPVLAPARWLRRADPLPHSWDVTSDSIAAWIAGCVGARRLVLVKPSGVRRPADAVDPYFARALPPAVDAVVIAADQIDELRSALRQM
jgi:aspartokinase-like uncharacterized kinase